MKDNKKIQDAGIAPDPIHEKQAQDNVLRHEIEESMLREKIAIVMKGGRNYIQRKSSERDEDVTLQTVSDFFLLHIPFMSSTQVPTLATNYNYIIYNPYFINTLYDKAVCHFLSYVGDAVSLQEILGGSSSASRSLTTTTDEQKDVPHPIQPTQEIIFAMKNALLEALEKNGIVLHTQEERDSFFSHIATYARFIVTGELSKAQEALGISGNIQGINNRLGVMTALLLSFPAVHISDIAQARRIALDIDASLLGTRQVVEKVWNMFEKNIGGILLHEVLHIIRGDVTNDDTRRQGYVWQTSPSQTPDGPDDVTGSILHYYLNCAMDAVINDIIENELLVEVASTGERVRVLPEGCVLCPDMEYKEEDPVTGEIHTRKKETREIYEDILFHTCLNIAKRNHKRYKHPGSFIQLELDFRRMFREEQQKQKQQQAKQGPQQGQSGEQNQQQGDAPCSQGPSSMGQMGGTSSSSPGTEQNKKDGPSQGGTKTKESPSEIQEQQGNNNKRDASSSESSKNKKNNDSDIENGEGKDGRKSERQDKQGQDPKDDDAGKNPASSSTDNTIPEKVSDAMSQAIEEVFGIKGAKIQSVDDHQYSSERIREQKEKTGEDPRESALDALRREAEKHGIEPGGNGIGTGSCFNNIVIAIQKEELQKRSTFMEKMTQFLHSRKGYVPKKTFKKMNRANPVLAARGFATGSSLALPAYEYPNINGHVMIAIDVSGSMNNEWVKNAAVKVVNLLNAIKKGNLISIVQIDDGIVDWQTFETGGPDVKKYVHDVERNGFVRHGSGGTGYKDLFNVINMSVNKKRTEFSETIPERFPDKDYGVPRRVEKPDKLIFFTDGGFVASELPLLKRVELAWCMSDNNNADFGQGEVFVYDEWDKEQEPCEISL